MSTQNFPFQLEQTIFFNTEFYRIENLPDPLEIHFNVEIKADDNKFPDALNVFLKLRTSDTENIKILIEMIGVYSLVKGESIPEKELIDPFIKERAIFTLWPIMVQYLKYMLSNAAIEGINLPYPYKYNLQAISDKSSS